MDDLAPCPRCGQSTYMRGALPQFRNSRPQRCDSDGWFHICELPAINLNPSMEEWCAAAEVEAPALPEPRPVAPRPEPVFTKSAPKRAIPVVEIP